MYTGEDVKKETYMLAAWLWVILLSMVFFIMSCHFCRGDGCIGLALIFLCSLIALLIQIFILVPRYCIRRHRANKPFAAFAIYWIGGSVAAFGIPLVLANLSTN